MACTEPCEHCGEPKDVDDECGCDKAQLESARKINREVFAHAARLAKKRRELTEFLSNRFVTCKHCGEAHDGFYECGCDKSITEAISKENEEQRAKNRETMKHIEELEAEIARLKESA
jgi:DNA repair exonuclease SbcCD ATPase subunit